MQVPSSYIPISVNSTNNFKQQKPQKFGFLLTKEQSGVLAYLENRSPEYFRSVRSRMFVALKDRLAKPKSDEVLYEALAQGYSKKASETANPLKKWYFCRKQRVLEASLLTLKSMLY